MTRKDEIVVAARRCFAEKGFAATSVRDIEAAAGLSPGAGGIYRHVRSKDELLAAVVDAEVRANREALAGMHAPPPDADLRTALEHGAREGLAQLDRQVDLMRIVFRDLDRFPELVAQVRAEITDVVYRAFADRVAPALAGRDAEALAVLAIGPLVVLKLKQHLLGFTPLDVDEDRLVAVWVDLFATYLGAGR